MNAVTESILTIRSVVLLCEFWHLRVSVEFRVVRYYLTQLLVDSCCCCQLSVAEGEETEQRAAPPRAACPCLASARCAHGEPPHKRRGRGDRPHAPQRGPLVLPEVLHFFAANIHPQLREARAESSAEDLQNICGFTCRAKTFSTLVRRESQLCGHTRIWTGIPQSRS